MADWKKEAARDLLALGSLPFYFIAIVRMLIAAEFSVLVPQLVIALLFTFAVFNVLKLYEFEYHISLGLIIVVFTSLGYGEFIFTFFAALLWILMLYSAYYLKIRKEKIIGGAVVGVVSSIIAYFTVNILF